MHAILKDKTFWVLLILSAAYILINIGSGSLTTWDEALYANVSYNILRTGDWLILHDRPGKPWFDKPPLYMWCTALLFKIFGISEFSVRLTSGIFGIAVILLVYIFVKKIYGKEISTVASLLLLATPHFLHFTKMGMMDVMLTFFITLMVYLFWIGQEKPQYLFWSGLILIFAYLSKGFAAIFGPAVIFLYCLLSGNLRLIMKREFIIGICASILAIIAWHLAQYIYAGPGALTSYFGLHIFKRATTSLEGHNGGLNFYQKVVFNKNIPWGVLFYASLAYMVWLIAMYKDRFAVLIFSWAAAIYIIATAIQTKLHWYVVPIYPALAISSAIFLGGIVKKRLLPLIPVLIFIGMLIQIPLSWAFKLDLNPKVKEAAAHSVKLPYEDNGTIFYYETIKNRSRVF